jgi:hypothetical protein
MESFAFQQKKLVNLSVSGVLFESILINREFSKILDTRHWQRAMQTRHFKAVAVRAGILS